MSDPKFASGDSVAVLDPFHGKAGEPHTILEVTCPEGGVAFYKIAPLGYEDLAPCWRWVSESLLKTAPQRDFGSLFRSLQALCACIEEEIRDLNLRLEDIRGEIEAVRREIDE